MFILSKLRDTIRVPACELGRPIEDVLAFELNRQFANKVVLNVGLIICLHDIISIGESHIYSGDGAIHTSCTYRLLVFRPQVGEILCGTLKSSSKEGLTISLGFFDSVIIPAEHLNEPSTFNETDQIWTWSYDDEENQTHKLPLEIGELVKFRVFCEYFVDILPEGPTDTPGSTQSKAKHGEAEKPYTVIGSICESGLGLVKWWL